MNSIWTIVAVICLSSHSAFAEIEKASAESGESAEQQSAEENPYDRGLGFKKKVQQENKYPFPQTPPPSWTESPNMLQKEKDLGRNDIEDSDKDYFAHYDFEFAKSGINHPNFGQKYLRYQQHALDLARFHKDGGQIDESFVHKDVTPSPNVPKQRNDVDGVLRGLSGIV